MLAEASAKPERLWTELMEASAGSVEGQHEHRTVKTEPCTLRAHCWMLSWSALTLHQAEGLPIPPHPTSTPFTWMFGPTQAQKQ